MATSVSIREALDIGGVISISPKGQSMLPFVRDTDTVVIKKPTEKLKKYDCVLFFKTDEIYVLHRLIKINGDTCITLGDNNKKADPPVKTQDIVGVLDGIYRNGKYIQVYGKPVSLFIKIDCLPFVRHVRLFIRRVFNKIGRILKGEK